LESAVEVDPGTPNEVFNTGGVKPEEDANPTALTRKDLDILVSKYPRDFRAYMFRGLFYSSFTLYSENYYAPTFADLNRALDMNPNSALVHYFLGRIAQRMTFWTKAAARDISDINGASGGYKAKTHQKALQHFDAAIQLDPNFALAYADAAEELLSLKRYSDAIPYYDKAIDLRPADAGAYNDEKERLGERQLPLAATRGESTFVPLLENYIGVAKLLITVAAASIAFGGNQNSNIGVYLAKIVLAFSILYGVAFAALLQYFYDEYSQNVNAYTPWRYSMIEALGFSALGSFVSGFLLWAFHLR